MLGFIVLFLLFVLAYFYYKDFNNIFLKIFGFIVLFLLFVIYFIF